MVAPMGWLEGPQHWDQGAWSIAVGILGLLAGIVGVALAVDASSKAREASSKARTAEQVSHDVQADVLRRLASARISGLIGDLDRAADAICEGASKERFRSGCRSWKEASPRLHAALHASSNDSTTGTSVGKGLLLVAGKINDSLQALDSGAGLQQSRTELSVDIRATMDDARRLRAEIESEVSA